MQPALAPSDLRFDPTGAAATLELTARRNAPMRVSRARRRVSAMKRPRRTVSGVAIVCSLAGVLLALPLTTSPVSASAVVGQLRAPRVTQFARVPVRACPTEYASTGATHYPPVPRWRRIAIPADLASKVAVYTDPRQVIRIIGPRGSNCIASLENGPFNFLIFEPGQRTPTYDYTEHLPDGLIALNVIGFSGGSVDSLLQTCPYFRSSRLDLYKEPWVRQSMCRFPRGEVVTSLKANLTRVDDPPHFAGRDAPSGGHTWALGNVHRPDTWGSYFMTCALPPSMHAVCYSSLAWFNSHWG